MKKYWIAALAVALLPVCTSRASAITFQPVLSGQPGAQSAPAAGLQPVSSLLYSPSRLSMAVHGTFWDLPDVSVAGITGFNRDRIQFQPLVMPVVAVEYRLSDQWGIGGWYNPLNTDLKFRGPTADLLTGGSSPLLRSSLLGTATLNMWDAHFTYQFPENVALQAGIVNYHGALEATVPDPRQPGNLHLRAGMGGTELHIWGYKSYHIWGYTGKPSYFTGGLGVRQRLSSEQDTSGPKAAAQASATYTYHPRQNLALDLSTWFADFTDGDAFSIRVNAGMTGHF